MVIKGQSTMSEWHKNGTFYDDTAAGNTLSAPNEAGEILFNIQLVREFSDITGTRFGYEEK